jgi:cation:H+ antiporter
MQSIALLLAGFLLLVAGGELLVRGSVAVAKNLGVSSLLIGIVLVGFGTSMPELVTCVQASLAGSPGLALGNIVGSNISNILLILGIAALTRPITVAERALRRDGVIMFLSALVFVAIATTYDLERLIGVALLAGLAAYLTLAVMQERGATVPFPATEIADAPVPPKPAEISTLKALGIALFGLFVLLIGGELLVTGGIATAKLFAVPETVIGLTVVAVGTSMPELVTCVIAAMRRQGDVALGNILGSSIYNTLGVAGATGVIAPTAIPSSIASFDVYIMLGAATLLMLFAATGHRVSRFEGAILVAGYLGYLALMWPGGV